jgi:hypothetical protein
LFIFFKLSIYLFCYSIIPSLSLTYFWRFYIWLKNKLLFYNSFIWFFNYYIILSLYYSFFLFYSSILLNRIPFILFYSLFYICIFNSSFIFFNWKFNTLLLSCIFFNSSSKSTIFIFNFLLYPSNPFNLFNYINKFFFSP